MYSLFIYESSHNDLIFDRFELIKLLDQNHILKYNTLTDRSSFYTLKLYPWVTFLGCSPDISNIKNTIQIKHFESITPLGAESIQSISCPKCKHKIPDPHKIIKQNFYKCFSCKNKIPPSEINWRKTVGFSQSFIQIQNIFPKEAIPNDSFIELLSNFSKSSWNYFYSKSINW